MSEIKKIIQKIKAKSENSFFSRLENIVENYWDRWIKIRQSGYDVTVKNPGEIKAEIDFSSFKFPESFKIENPEEIAEYIIIPKVKDFPKELKISNLAELSKYIEVKERIVIPDSFKIKNLKDIPKIEFPDNLKNLSLSKTEEILTKLVKQLVKDKKNKNEVYVKNSSPEEHIPVRLVNRKGDDWLEAFGNSIISVPSEFNIKNTADEKINPATEEKQDDIITELGKMTGFEITAYDYVSRGWVAGTFTETWTFKTGGGGGTTVATLVIVYDDVNMTNIVTVTKT